MQMLSEKVGFCGRTESWRNLFLPLRQLSGRHLFFFIVIVIWCLDRFESETAAFASSGSVKSSVEVIGEICEGKRFVKMRDL